VTPDVEKHLACLETRSLIIQAIRDFFTDSGYLEVETPVLCPSIIPEAQIEPVNIGNNYLQASPELCMKRLLSKGFDKIFQICKCFRKNERGPRHLPELTLLEWYTRDHTYLDLMDQCQALIRFIIQKLAFEIPLHYQGRAIHFSSPWPRLTVKNAFQKYSDTDVFTALETNRFDEIISFEIEPCLENITTPVFLCDYPASQASLSKLLPGNSDCAQRFELYISGIEIANGFTELNDPEEQALRFEKENQIRISMNKPPVSVPKKFLEDLKTMPEAAGIALGVDRLVMILCNAKTIDEVITFPPEQL